MAEIPICLPQNFECVNSIAMPSDCLSSCQGLFVTGFERIEFEESEKKKILSKVNDDYDLYTAGKFWKKPSKDVVKDFKWHDLKLVSIYFDTPGYDEITKDTAAKFVDRLSAIGGQLGLLTGFSIISGVEILYFLAKFLLSCVEKEIK